MLGQTWKIFFIELSFESACDVMLCEKTEPCDTRWSLNLSSSLQRKDFRTSFALR